MRSKLALCLVFAFASVAYARDPKPYQTGKLTQMNSVNCGTTEKDAKDKDKKTQDLLCQEYVIEAEQVTYHIRPRDEKHLVLLPVGEYAQFRLQKDKMLLRVEDLDNKEHEYTVVSMTPTSDSNTAESSSSSLNHLQ
jgi:hypothetical protein